MLCFGQWEQEQLVQRYCINIKFSVVCMQSYYDLGCGSLLMEIFYNLARKGDGVYAKGDKSNAGKRQ